MRDGTLQDGISYENKEREKTGTRVIVATDVTETRHAFARLAKPIDDNALAALLHDRVANDTMLHGSA